MACHYAEAATPRHRTSPSWLSCSVLAAAGVASAGRRQPVHLRLYMHVPRHHRQAGARVHDGAALRRQHYGGHRRRPRHGDMLSSQHEEVVVVAITVVPTAGPTTAAPSPSPAGRDRIHGETRGLAVVGGTGRLRRAAGHVVWTTAALLSEVHMVLELDVHMSVPASDGGGAATAHRNGSAVAFE
ncbi:hypothetical protein ACP4OV_012016 [Aristida adscensionis]